MKFVLLLLAVLALVLLVRNSVRRRLPPQAPSAPTAPTAPQQIVSCAHCGLHLPRDEALPGRGGVFCDAAHRAAFEQQHPAS